MDQPEVLFWEIDGDGAKNNKHVVQRVCACGFSVVHGFDRAVGTSRSCRTVHISISDDDVRCSHACSWHKEINLPPSNPCGNCNALIISPEDESQITMKLCIVISQREWMVMILVNPGKVILIKTNDLPISPGKTLSLMLISKCQQSNAQK